MPPGEHKAIIREHVEVLFNQHRVDRTDETVTPDYLDHAPLPGQAPGLEGAKQKWAMYLAAADGTGSAVRRLLVPDAGLDDLHPMIYGKTPIGPNTLDRVPEVLIDTFNHLSGPDGVSFSVATCRTWEPVAGTVAARGCDPHHVTRARRGCQRRPWGRDAPPRHAGRCGLPRRAARTGEGTLRDADAALRLPGHRPLAEQAVPAPGRAGQEPKKRPWP